MRLDIMLVAAPFAALVAIALWRAIPRSAGSRFDAGYRRFLRKAKQRGLTPEQTSQEFQFRHAFARMQRLASERVLRSPADHQRIVAEAAASEASSLALLDRGLAKRFLTTVEQARLADILSEAAMEAANRAAPPRSKIMQIDHDELAAMNVRS